MSNETLVQRIKGGCSSDDDMQALYENNLPLIRKFIKPYTAYECEADLLQESYFGLVEAVKHYETDRNVRFMTFAQYYILLAVRKYIEKCGSTVRIPSNTRAKFTQLRKAIQKLEQEQSRTPTAKETAALMGVSVEEVQEIKVYMQGVASTDTPLADDSSLTLSDTLQADLRLEDDMIDKIYNEHCKNELWAVVERFTSIRENEIIKEYFINEKTMSQIARESGVSLDRIRQIKEKGLRRLRIGRAKRILLEKFDIADCMLYRGGFNDYKEKGCSIVERTAIKRIEAEERYRIHLEEIEELHRQRLLRG